MISIMRLVSRESILEGLAAVSFNLSAAWLGILLIAPGFLRVPGPIFWELLTVNLPQAIIVLLLGMFLLERSKK